MKLQTVVIDDSILQRITTSFLVENHPCLHLVGAYSCPIEGLNAIVQNPIDLIILDIEMPELNGFQLMNQIDPEIQVIMNSTALNFADKAIHQGAVAFLNKPIQDDAFNTAIADVLINATIMHLLHEDVQRRLVHSRSYEFLEKTFEG